jgi:hypothetical protein
MMGRRLHPVLPQLPITVSLAHGNVGSVTPGASLGTAVGPHQLSDPKLEHLKRLARTESHGRVNVGQRSSNVLKDVLELRQVIGDFAHS